MTLSDIGLRNRIAAVACSALFLWALSPAGFSQSANASLPKVGTIKDYPATGLMTGCGNLYFYKAEHTNSTEANYVFLSRSGGSGAWMNLNGRDVRLRRIELTVRGQQNSRRYLYRHGDVLITVEFEDFAKEGAAGEGDHMFKMKITLRKGRAVRVVSAVGDADC